MSKIAKNSKKIYPDPGRRIFVAMSGGVDSSVAALLLKNQGYEAVGVFMRCFNLDGCAEKDAEDGRRVAEKLDIPFYIWDFEEEYKKRVVEYMIDGYRRGLTPNPDVMCNKEIKFGLFLEKALSMGAPASPCLPAGRLQAGIYVATGHYVRKLSFGLEVAKDASKDQSYFLWTLTQEQLNHCLFPIGDYLKSEVREIAQKAGLPTADKKDSQGICFLGKVTLADFLKEYIPERRGEVLLALSGVEGTTYKKIGEHIGSQFYTIGQRHIGVSNGQPVYVAEKDVAANTLVVAEGSDNPALYKKEIELDDVNFINQEHSNILQNVGMLKVLARVRYRQPLAKASVTYQASSIRLIFDEPQKFVAPGQSAVFYAADGELLGGGVIV